MKMSTVTRMRGVFAGVWMLAIAIVLCGCPSAETKSDQKEPSQKKTDSTAQPSAESRSEPEIEKPPKTPAESPLLPTALVTEAEAEAKEKPRDLGPPLVDNPDLLTPLFQGQPIWIDMKNKQVVMLGTVCKADTLLEYFASHTMRAYESVVSVNVPSSLVHAGLLRIGAKPGQPVRFQPRFVSPSGMEIAIEVRWKDQQGKVQSALAQHWVRDVKTKKELDVNWVFAGSYFRKNENTGQESYQADDGAMICLANMPEAMLDLPIESDSAVGARSFEAFKEHLPPPGTPTTLLLKPIFAKKPATDKPPRRAVTRDSKKIAEAERKALRAATDWLDLIDRGQYSRGWETASERLNIIIARREFIKSLNDTRKPLGKVKSRRLSSKKYTRSIPDAPDGQYVIIRYTTSFEKQPSAVEVVKMVLNGDNRWRVLGYHFK